MIPEWHGYKVSWLERHETAVLAAIAIVSVITIAGVVRVMGVFTGF